MDSSGDASFTVTPVAGRLHHYRAVHECGRGRRRQRCQGLGGHPRGDPPQRHPRAADGAGSDAGRRGSDAVLGHRPARHHLQLRVPAEAATGFLWALDGLRGRGVPEDTSGNPVTSNTVTGLTNGTYAFKVRALGATRRQRPSTRPAKPPTRSRVTLSSTDDSGSARCAHATSSPPPATRQVTLSWSAPAADGGAAISRYEYKLRRPRLAAISASWTTIPTGGHGDPDLHRHRPDERDALLLSGCAR